MCLMSLANTGRAPTIHVSRLALHTEHLLRDPRVGLYVSEPDRSGKNPLALRRMNLQGEAALLNAGASDYAEVKERYLARFPQSAMMFGFADFALWELRLQDAHLILGFGQAYLCRRDYSSHLDTSEAGAEGVVSRMLKKSASCYAEMAFLQPAVMA